jgi:hypothetical protein
MGVFRDREVDFTSIDGLTEAGKLYFSWLFSISKNVVRITTNAIDMNWGVNESEETPF